MNLPDALDTLINQIKREERQKIFTPKKITLSALRDCKSELEFVTILGNMFEKMKFRNVTVLHRSSRPEHGKDIVFHQIDSI